MHSIIIIVTLPIVLFLDLDSEIESEALNMINEIEGVLRVRVLKGIKS